MSEMEFNKGKLFLVSYNSMEFARELAKRNPEHFPGDLSAYEDDDVMDFLLDSYEKYAVIGDKVFLIKWELQGETEAYINELEKIDGGYSFFTYHYNGGAHWTELVEQKMQELNSE